MTVASSLIYRLSRLNLGPTHYIHVHIPLMCVQSCCKLVGVRTIGVVENQIIGHEGVVHGQGRGCLVKGIDEERSTWPQLWGVNLKGSEF